MRDCKNILPDLVAYLDGELEAAARAIVEAHLAACAACRAERDALARAGALLAGYPAPEPTAGFEARVRERIGRGAGRVIQPARPAWSRFAVPLGIAAAVLLGGLGVAARLGVFDAALEAPLDPHPQRQVAREERQAPPGPDASPEPEPEPHGSAVARGPEAPAIALPGRGPEEEAELIARLDLVENLDLLENLEMLEVYDAPEDPTQGLEEERG